MTCRWKFKGFFFFFFFFFAQAIIANFFLVMRNGLQLLFLLQKVIKQKVIIYVFEQLLLRLWLDL